MPTEEKQFYIYLHCKPDGTPFYVGKGSGKRAYDFKPSTRQANIWHKRIVAKYGKENIIVEVLLCLSEQEAFEQEQLFILLLCEQNIELCNLTDGGDGVLNPSPEIRAKMASYGMLGKHQSDYQKEVVKRTHTNKIISEETKEKQRKIALLRGPLSTETKIKIGMSQKGKSKPKPIGFGDTIKKVKANMSIEEKDQMKRKLSISQKKRYKEHPDSYETRLKKSRSAMGNTNRKGKRVKNDRAS